MPYRGGTFANSKYIYNFIFILRLVNKQLYKKTIDCNCAIVHKNVLSDTVIALIMTLIKKEIHNKYLSLHFTIDLFIKKKGENNLIIMYKTTE